MAVMTIASFISTVAYFIMTSFMFGGTSGRDRRGAGSLVIVYIVALFVYFISLILVRLLSRYRELAADRGSAIITGKPRTLINALTKISGQMQQIPKKDLRAEKGLNQFFIIPAISGRSIAELFSTHPSLEKRIRALERMERAMESS